MDEAFIKDIQRRAGLTEALHGYAGKASRVLRTAYHKARQTNNIQNSKIIAVQSLDSFIDAHSDKIQNPQAFRGQVWDYVMGGEVPDVISED